MKLIGLYFILPLISLFVSPLSSWFLPWFGISAFGILIRKKLVVDDSAALVLLNLYSFQLLLVPLIDQIRYGSRIGQIRYGSRIDREKAHLRRHYDKANEKLGSESLQSNGMANDKLDSESLQSNGSQILARLASPNENAPYTGVSIVIPTHNEHAYIRRTIESILEETPKVTLAEILVIDDGSEPAIEADLPVNLEKVKIIRFKERKGLITAKQIGGDVAVGSVVIFLDGHVKPESGWLKYILRDINTNEKRIVVPAVPILDGMSWTVAPNAAIGYKMMFSWDLGFQWFEDANDEVPCMSGGLLAVSKKWWNYTGGLDDGLRQWGIENIEQVGSIG